MRCSRRIPGELELTAEEEPMRPKGSLAMLAICLALPLALASCGDDDDDTTAQNGATTTEGAAGSSTVAVSETEYKLDPTNPAVEPGTVTFQISNDGAQVHALEVEGPGGESETEDIQPGESASLTVDLSQPGTYEWYCPIANHKELGMEGEIKVAGAAGSAPPPDDSGGEEDSDSSGSGGYGY
jgi:uncharacterized cupredoxin-like copper-binding protein